LLLNDRAWLMLMRCKVSAAARRQTYDLQTSYRPQSNSKRIVST